MGRVLALDAGTVRIGVALSDPLRLTAQPHSFLDASGDVEDRVAALVTEMDVDTIVVGLPLSLDGGEGPSADLARQLADRIAARVDVRVELYDERFSSVTAERVMLQAGARRAERRQARDKVAAAVFLQAYLDGLR